ncbi:MAG: hemK [Rhodospirillaceae bacterium]|nr:MAG: hemK [Rhodospirillaceae bacterium]
MNDSVATISVLLSRATACLAAAGVETPRLDARLLLAHVLGVTPHDLVLRENPLPSAEQRAFEALIARRAVREPVSRILGRRGFWSLDLCLDAETFDPRSDTETVVEAVLERTLDRQAPYTVLDLGTGSGCLLLALLAELPWARGLGVDIEAKTLAVAHANALAAGLAARAVFRVGNWGEGLQERFDIIVANPPYIAEADLDSLAPEVARFDPRRALAGGRDGFDAYRTLAPHLYRVLRPGGVAALEIGQGQAKEVERLMICGGMAFLGARADLSGVVRCMVFHRGNQNDGN